MATVDDLSRTEYPAMLVCADVPLTGSVRLSADSVSSLVGAPPAQPGRAGVLRPRQAHYQDKPGDRRLASGTARQSWTTLLPGIPETSADTRSVGAPKGRGAVCRGTAQATRLQGP